MAKARMTARLVGGCLLVWSTAQAALAAPTVAQMLSFRPKQEGVAVATPQDPDKCKVELVKAGKGSGWLLRDETGMTVRRYFDTNGDNKIDVWSYYLKGQEVYREVDSNLNDKADQFRWYYTGGTRWGVDVNEDGKVDSWKTISPEEVSQEALQALAARDAARLQALLITEPEMKALELPAAEQTRIRDLVRQAPAKLQATATKLGQGDKLRWIHLELQTPQCLPTDATGMKVDLVRYPGGAMLYQSGDRSDWLQLPELIQVGTAWRLIDAPTPGAPTEAMGGAEPMPEANPALQPLLVELQAIDKEAPGVSAAADEMEKYNKKRAVVLEKIVAQAKPAEKDQWVRQLGDCLSIAAQSNPADKATFQKLVALREQVTKASAGSDIAAYVTYCELSADNAILMASPEAQKDYAKVQKEWMDKLAKFVQDYPKSDNTPDALMQLGMLSELSNDEGPAKKWYDLLHRTFPSHASAAKAKGAVDRLGLKGKDLELAGPVIGGGQFDAKSLKGKVVVVYYWASWNGQCANDFAKLKELTASKKDLAVVCVNMDDSLQAAEAFLKKSPAPGNHLFEQGGQNSRLATQYGIMVLPTLFLVDKDGKVLNPSAQMSTLEDEIKKALN